MCTKNTVRRLSPQRESTAQRLVHTRSARLDTRRPVASGGMTNRAFRTVLEGGSYFEGPRWHEGAWWASDFYRHTVSRVAPEGGETVVLEVENQPSGLGWLPDGSLLVVSMKDQRLLRLTDGEVSTHADLSDVCGG